MNPPEGWGTMSCDFEVVKRLRKLEPRLDGFALDPTATFPYTPATFNHVSGWGRRNLPTV